MGKTLDLARKDWNKIITSGGFESDITLEKPGVFGPIVVKGLATIISREFDFESGAYIRSDKATCTISIQALIDASYPYRDSNGNVNLLGDKADFDNSEGITRKFKVAENFADETVGVITLSLVNYGTN